MSKWRRFVAATKRFGRDDGGQAMTEAALILPLFMVTICMTLELCVLATVRSVVNYACYSATRAGIVHNADPLYMVNAASIALSPVAQSDYISTKPGTDGYDTYGTWDHQGEVLDRSGTALDTNDKFSDENAAKKLGARSLNLLMGTAISMLQFTKGWSQAEYLKNNINNLEDAVDPIVEAIKNGDILALPGLISNAVNVIGGILFAPPINQLTILRAHPIEAPTDPPTVIAQTGHWLNPFTWNTKDLDAIGTKSTGLLTEGGGKADGFDWVKNNYSTSGKALRLRVRLMHRHRLMFPFLRMVYDEVLQARKDEGRTISATDQAVADLAKQQMMVQIESECVMRMQSNFTLKQVKKP